MGYTVRRLLLVMLMIVMVDRQILLFKVLLFSQTLLCVGLGPWKPSAAQNLPPLRPEPETVSQWFLW